MFYILYYPPWHSQWPREVQDIKFNKYVNTLAQGQCKANAVTWALPFFSHLFWWPFYLCNGNETSLGQASRLLGFCQFQYGISMHVCIGWLPVVGGPSVSNVQWRWQAVNPWSDEASPRLLVMSHSYSLALYEALQGCSTRTGWLWWPGPATSKMHWRWQDHMLLWNQALDLIRWACCWSNTQFGCCLESQIYIEALV